MAKKKFKKPGADGDKPKDEPKSKMSAADRKAKRYGKKEVQKG